MRKFLLGVGALIALAVILVGIPIALVLVAGNPLPTAEQFQSTINLVPDYGNVILLTKILPCIAWVAWALFAIPVLIEVVAGIAGRQTTKRTWAFKGQQHIAAALIAAVLVMFAGSLLGPAQSASAAPIAPQNVASQSVTIPASVLAAIAETPAAPVAAPAAPVTHTETVSHTVKEGENLWEIAQHYYGHGDREGEIFAASTGTVQPGGGRFTNPSLILPGWVLTVPNVQVTDPPAPAPVVPPAPAAPAPSSSASAGSQSSSAAGSHATENAPAATAGGSAATTPTAAPTASASPTSHAPSVSAVSKPADEGSDLIPLATAGGISGLLAAGLLLALGRRRIKQRRRREAGSRIAMPDPEAATLELELRMVETPLGLDDIDNSMRALQIWAEDTGAKLPELLAVRLVAEEISVYLTAPADLPEPFESVSEDRTAWVVRPGTAKPPVRATVSPYPALATIGVDEQGGVLLLDLEQLGALNVVGDEGTAQGVLNAVAVELAENPWSDQIQVTLVGMPSGLAHDLNRFRAKHVDDVEALIRNLRSTLRGREEAFASYGVNDVHAARTRATEAEAWAPHIVILGEVPAEEFRVELEELVSRIPRLGMATVAHGMVASSGSTVQVESAERAVLVLPGEAMLPLPFRPQVLQGRELELIQQLFATTEQEAVPAPVYERSEPVVEQLVDETPADATATVAVMESEGQNVAVAAADVAESVEDAFPGANCAQGGQEEATEAVSEPVMAEVPIEVPIEVAPDWPAPYVRLLGTVDALHVADNESMPGRGVELMAYLMLQDGPAEGLMLRKAFWPNTKDAQNNQRKLANQARAALGTDPSGSALFPENVNHQGYLLHSAIRTDWDDFRELIGPDLSRTSSEKLIAAIRLVRGTPFAGCDTRRWWQWISIPQEEMIASIMDAAEELGRRALKTRDAEQVRFAAHVEQAVDPLNEAGWRIEMHAAMQAGNMEEFFKILDDLYARVGGDDTEYELDDETQQLVDQAQQKTHA